MLKWLYVFTGCLSVLGSAADVVPHDQAYYTAGVRNTELIYTQKNLPVAKTAAVVQMYLQPRYEQLFGYVMDEPMYVGLLSDYNQLANGFMTPYPNNRQMNYIGGAMIVDYFSATSWLKTLLYHETAHNYQINLKESAISRTLHDIFRNGMVFMPWFTYPNITESSFLLEGNAVLNESCHENGGRLYSGRFKAEMLMQAQAGYLTPERIYNDNYFFLYGAHHYTLGGFYQYYLAQQYGLLATNRYWKEHAKEWFWPFFTNSAMQRTIGVDFETSVAQWSEQMYRDASQVVVVRGEPIATSQFFTPLNSNRHEIFFLINESGRERPKLVRMNRQNLHVNKERRSLIAGKVLQLNGKYVTQAAAMTSPLRMYQGLYDTNAYLVEGTASKVVHGYLRDGRAVYFDVSSSFDTPQLYVGEDFYAQVNSSVYIDTADNLYYFVQEGTTRTLYKNRTPLTRFEGYYGFVTDVDAQGAVYFIANSPYGSTLYRVNHNTVERLSRGDTIIDARLIDETKALVALVGSDAYRYEVIALDPKEQPPHEVLPILNTLMPLDISAPSPSPTPPVDLNHPYHSVLNMNYSGTDLFLGRDEHAGTLYNVNVNFSDPLLQNTLALFSWRNSDAVSVAGVRYRNSQYLLQYTLEAYGVIDEESNLSTRDYGVAAQLRLPWLRKGYYDGDIRLNYIQEYETQKREPLAVTLTTSRQEWYGVSMYPNVAASVSLYAMRDRDDTSYGGSLSWSQDLWTEHYITLEGQHVSSDAKTFQDERGIKVSKTHVETLYDPTTVVMPSLRDTLYIERATVARIRYSSVFNISAYYFTFPLSLHRESLDFGYSHYRLQGFRERVDVNEFSMGMTFDTLWFNRLNVPVNVSYYYNDTQEIAKRQSVLFSLGIAF